ncbi:ribonuclease HII [Syntrophomonas erecta]
MTKIDNNEQELDEQERQRLEHMKQYEYQARCEGYEYIAGLDEAGRGPIAGPVVAAVVILPQDFNLPGVNDSKQLTAARRRQLVGHIKDKALDWAAAAVYPPLLDKINIYQATVQAMQLAVNCLEIRPDCLLIDALSLKDIHIPQRAIIKGDSLSISIACASIIAKVERDQMMEGFESIYPGYGFARHKGYATRQHIEALLEKGPCPIHRVSFEPVKFMVTGGDYAEQPGLFDQGDAKYYRTR